MWCIVLTTPQRQITKTGLSDQMLDHSSKTGDSKDCELCSYARELSSHVHSVFRCRTEGYLFCESGNRWVSDTCVAALCAGSY